MLEDYTRVKIKGTEICGTIVAIDTDGDTKQPLYAIEKDDEYKKRDGQDIVWHLEDDLISIE